MVDTIECDELFVVEEHIKKELDSRKALASHCFERERKIRVPYIGSLPFVITWACVVVFSFLFGLMVLLSGATHGNVALWFFGVGIILVIPMRYFGKRNRAFAETFKAQFPSEARLLGWK